LRNKKPSGSVLHINNPGNLNRMSLKTIKALKKELHKLNNIPTSRLLVLRGSGNQSFSNGIDIFEIYEAVKTGDEFLPIELFREMYKLSYYISQMTTPTMSILNGKICKKKIKN
jgi:enoyl-CoA hydratase/carnithine racemase